VSPRSRFPNRARGEPPPPTGEISDAVEVTVAIVNWNSGDDLTQCVNALRKNTEVAWELVVIDNGSTDGSVERLRDGGVVARVIQTERNLGYAGGVNEALKLVRSPFVLLVNPDAFVHPGCLDRLLARAKMGPRIGAVGPGLRNPDGSLQPAIRNFPSPLTHLVEAFRLYRPLRFLPGLDRRYLLVSKQRQAQAVDWIVGACTLLRMDAVNDVGPFDAGYFMYSEELDWCIRAQRKGWQIWFEPTAVATHRLGGSSRLNELPLMVESYRSMYRFYAKHYPPSWTAAARVITRAAMLARALVLVFRRRRGADRLAAYREIARL
jgi:N-acetylglucosaminyl-diphospho-decaprenol L-rhamnosyltransferase